jgi:hypothetical protein
MSSLDTKFYKFNDQMLSIPLSSEHVAMSKAYEKDVVDHLLWMIYVIVFEIRLYLIFRADKRSAAFEKPVNINNGVKISNELYRISVYVLSVLLS